MATELQYLIHGARSLIKTSAMRKQAGFADALSGLASKVDLHNPLHTGAIGAGIGGLSGLVGSEFSGEDPEKKSRLRALLMGGLTGGGLGAAAGALNPKPKLSPLDPSTPFAQKANENSAKPVDDYLKARANDYMFQPMSGPGVNDNSYQPMA